MKLLTAALVASVLLPGTAGAAAPAVSVAPPSGGPGTRVTVTGSGFCARAACGVVRLTISGRQFAVDQRPDAAGRFRTTTQMPGGLTAGEHDVVAHQVLDDGNEVSATASFVYSPSRGEEAERQAEDRDALAHLVNPSNNPSPSPRGLPFEAAGDPSAVAAASASAAAAALASFRAAGNDDGGISPIVVAGAAAAGIAVLVTGGLMWRRRNFGGVSS